MSNEKEKFISLREVESYKEEFVVNAYRSWKCEMESSPYDSTYNYWNFQFTFPVHKEDEKIISFEVSLELFWETVIIMVKIYNNKGEIIDTKPLQIRQRTLREMIEHAKKIAVKFKKIYGLY